MPSISSRFHVKSSKNVMPVQVHTGLSSSRSHVNTPLLMIQSLAKGKVFQSCCMSHSTKCFLKPSQELHAHTILKLWSYKIVSLPTLLLCFQNDCQVVFNNPRLLVALHYIVICLLEIGCKPFLWFFFLNVTFAFIEGQLCLVY